MDLNFPDKDTFRILISTDNHLGYKENHPVRGNDPFDAFEEVIRIAKDNNVDFLLLGGDLFHELNPSQRCLYKAVSLLEKHVFGDKPINFGITNYLPNYCNENMNISLPIFIIHGNHDYPATQESISAIDILSSCNLINYFGKQKEIDEIVVEPILLQKGSTKIALYGLGHIKDIKLHQCFERGNIKFANPPSEDYFSILVLHQNRYKGVHAGAPTKNCIHPKMLPSFVNLVIWGHEHESIPSVNENAENGFYVYQPGSSTITSLIEAEAKPKHVGLFEIKAGEFTHNPIFLQSARPLLFKSVELKDIFDPESQKTLKNKDSSKQEAWIAKQLERQIEEMILEYSKRSNTNAMLPIVRLKVEYTGFDILRVGIIEAKFLGRVANEGEILKMWKRVVPRPKNDRSLNNNSRLNNRFEETFSSKESFGSLFTDANESIRAIFQQLLEEERKQPRIIQLTSLFDRIPEVNIRNSYQVLEDVINENNITKGLIARLSKDFTINTSSFIGETSQLIERNYEDTQTQCDSLKVIDKQHDLPYQSLKSNILELTQELSLRSDSKSSKVSERQDTNRRDFEPSVRDNAELSMSIRHHIEEENFLNDLANKNYDCEETSKGGKMEQEYDSKYQGKQKMSPSMESEADDEESDDSLLENEFGRSLKKEDVAPKINNSNPLDRVGHQIESKLRKEDSKRKAPGVQGLESIQQQGKRIRAPVA